MPDGTPMWALRGNQGGAECLVIATRGDTARIVYRRGGRGWKTNVTEKPVADLFPTHEAALAEYRRRNPLKAKRIA